MGDTRNGVDNSARRSREQHEEHDEEYELNTLGRELTQAAPSSGAGLSSTAPREKYKFQWRTWTRLIFPAYIHQVPVHAARDHLANERVFLGYVRTSSALANFAITILQLYRLKHDPVPPGKLSDYNLGIPLAVVTLFIGIAITLAGAWRFFACQSAMARRKQIVTSGMVVFVFIPVFGLLLLALLILTVIVNPDI
ncbi:uncharacterized protein Z519_09463 [Cladophialophora bantiana CBS 173.52]|uniref:DUF202 domain-containing protein n=1 Tax=Cladophialophora bantiana (strain ATCC 10958 / CBS 173.52 / CDC B-1940 / NIH 8579) TaxID=1442370 RepID=A0A0D2H9Z8_CLAB1|nr:uncharacterized protein Z519_09463 [Cladophialophora bantiana CBS 173.52]KIW90033.1 hypothetical protein Z519_09463 [Cladophialophora bantiana CBS 173.52]